MKTASFHVGATAEQSRRWKMAAEAHGYRSVGSWLAVAADLYLKVRARAGNPVPLAWHKGSFRVLLADGREVEVWGKLSPPFGTFRGTADGPDLIKARTLVHLESRKVIATLRSARQCKALASELAPALLREDRELSSGVVARHQRESV
jgi:hypothetical protein